MKIDRNTLFGTAFLFSFALLSLSLFDVYSALSSVNKFNQESFINNPPSLNSNTSAVLAATCIAATREPNNNYGKILELGNLDFTMFEDEINIPEGPNGTYRSVSDCYEYSLRGGTRTTSDGEDKRTWEELEVRFNLKYLNNIIIQSHDFNDSVGISIDVKKADNTIENIIIDYDLNTVDGCGVSHWVSDITQRWRNGCYKTYNVPINREIKSIRFKHSAGDGEGLGLRLIKINTPTPTPTPTPVPTVNGLCGTANNSTVPTAPTTNLCSTGTATSVSGTGPWTWSCTGSGNGTTASCSANKTLDINGTCGVSNNAYVSIAPATNLCNTGTATSVSGTGPWTWSCTGSGNGTTASCSANISINGACGTAARTYFFSEKAYVGLYCSAGTVTPLFPAFPQPGEVTTWTCNGIGTGSTNITCTADVLSDEDQSCQNTDSAIFLEGTIRDFNDTHIDFENRRISGLKTGIVENLLDSEKKPVYTGINTNGSINGVDSFRQWYRDVPGVNQSMPFTIRLERVGSSTIFRYLSNQFFPIDNQLLGNQGRNHNFHFTFESQTSFLYQGGETFNFTGDDDIWLFVDGKLAMDLGGTHSPASQTVNMDSLGLTRGKIYTMNFFFAERHTTGSNFSIETDIKMANPVCINVDCTIDPTHPSCNFCLNPGQGNINQDSTTCSNPTRPKIKITDENSIGDKVTGIDASQDLKLDWTDTLPVQNSQCFASYNF
nr:fibro-slime domain-containing protein [Candidatus Dojkabacteria bacterium]